MPTPHDCLTCIILLTGVPLLVYAAKQAADDALREYKRDIIKQHDLEEVKRRFAAAETMRLVRIEQKQYELSAEIKLLKEAPPDAPKLENSKENAERGSTEP
jgi:ribosomal protein S21